MCDLDLSGVCVSNMWNRDSWHGRRRCIARASGAFLQPARHARQAFSRFIRAHNEASKVNAAHEQ